MFSKHINKIIVPYIRNYFENNGIEYTEKKELINPSEFYFHDANYYKYTVNNEYSIQFKIKEVSYMIYGDFELVIDVENHLLTITDNKLNVILALDTLHLYVDEFELV